MPGYRELASSYIGSAADSARQAESLRREGDPHNAVVLLEEALEASRRATSVLPGWLCGRLAALYRTLGRYDDEVALLERYRESQTSDEARSRYDARLSKARTIAERKRRSESGALLSVRKVLGAPRRRAASVSAPVLAVDAPVPADEFHADCLQLLDAPVEEWPAADFHARLDVVLVEHCSAARQARVPLDRLVQRLKAASQDVAGSRVTAAERDARYSTALVRLLATYFEESDR